MAELQAAQSSLVSTSLCHALNEKKKVAIAHHGAELNACKARLTSIEKLIEGVSAKLDIVITAMNQSSSVTHITPPPGIDRDAFQRIDRLEALLITNPPQKLSPSVDEVLTELLHKSTCTEPEKEPTPTKEKDNFLVLQSVVPPGPNFDDFDEYDLKSPPRENLDTIGECSPIFEQVMDATCQTINSMSSVEIQTESDTKEAATDTELDIQESRASVAKYFGMMAARQTKMEPSSHALSIRTSWTLSCLAWRPSLTSCSPV